MNLTSLWIFSPSLKGKWKKCEKSESCNLKILINRASIWRNKLCIAKLNYVIKYLRKIFKLSKDNFVGLYLGKLSLNLPLKSWIILYCLSEFHICQIERETTLKRKNFIMRTSLVIQRLRLCTPNAGGPGLIPGGGTRSHMPQLSVDTL